MRTASRFSTASLAITLILGAAIPQLAEGQSLNVVLRIQNQARIPDPVLMVSQSMVAAIYARAGIGLTFATGAADFNIVLLSRATGEKMHAPGDLLGFTPHGEFTRGRMAYVLQSRVDEVAEGYSARRPVVLGAAIAHEVGHLLLPVNAHSKTGIMRPSFTQADFRSAAAGQLLFTDEQSLQIRSRLMSEEERMAAR